MTTTATEMGVPPSAGGRAVDRLAGRVFGLPPASTDYTVARGIRIPMRDGVELAADLYRPTTGTSAGTLLVRGPYGRMLQMAVPFARIFAARGYHALFVSVRGTYGSGGAFDPMVHESDDGHDVVAWMRDQPWFTGSFATLGASYLGFTQWTLLMDPPPEMACAVVSVAPHDFGRYVWGTGSFRLDFLGWSHMVAHQEDGGVVGGMLNQARAERRNAKAMAGLPLVDAGGAFGDGRAPWYRDWVGRSDLNDPFWRPMDASAALDRAQLPILLLSGWQDLFLEQTIEQYHHLRDRGLDVAMTVGPWSHVAVGAGAARVNGAETFDWLEEHLARRATRKRPEPVHICVTGVDEWRYLPSWPPPTAPHTLYLHPHRDLAADPPPADAPASSFVFDPAEPTPSVGGPMLALRCIKDDTALAGRADVAAFTTPVLSQDLEVLGAPVLELVHDSDSPHADLFARISQVGPDGRSHNVTEGFVRLDPARDRSAVVRLELRPMAHRFVAGTRLRLIVAGGSHPQFARNLGTGDDPGTGTELRPVRHTIHHGEGGFSRLVLPVSVA
jgi:putative CocE/NonD family hydrolase